MYLNLTTRQRLTFLSNPLTRMSRTFQHKALAQNAPQIRLVEVIGGDQTINYRLLHTDLKTAPPYKALSYTWGPRQPEQTIVLNGTEFRVGSNLYSFLHTYQGNTKSSDRALLWIDQLCIDQNNAREKNSQVKMMASIYRGALEVVCWLGPANEHTQKAAWMLDLLESDYKLYHHAEWISRDPEVAGSSRQFFQDLVYTAPMRKKAVYPRPDENGVILTGSCKSAIWNLLRNPYWTRLWIVQEIMLAQRIMLWWGSTRITREGLVGLTEKLRFTYRDDVMTAWSHLCTILRKGRHREVPLGYELPASVTEELQSLVFTFCSYGCADRRDKVFALMGLVRPESLVKVDYTRTTKEVFLDAIRVMGQGIIKEANRLNDSVSWDLFLDTSCRLGVEMFPEQFEPLTKGAGYDRYRVAKRIGIDPERFLNNVKERERTEYVVKRLDAYLVS